MILVFAHLWQVSKIFLKTVILLIFFYDSHIKGVDLAVKKVKTKVDLAVNRSKLMWTLV